MARHKVFESDVATNTRVELYWNDATPTAGDSGWEADLINAADGAVATLELTTSQVASMISLWKSASNGTVCLQGGTGGVLATFMATNTRDNEMSWNVVEGANPEYAVLTDAQSSQLVSWLVCGWSEAPA